VSSPQPILRISEPAWQKVWLYIHLAEGEVGGLGRVERTRADEFVMTECFLIDQRATDVDTELDPAATSRFLLDQLKRGRDTAELRVWWHSHAREAVFWSTDDERTIDHFGGEWLVALVGNQSGKFLARFDQYEPKRTTIGWLDVVPPGAGPDLGGPLAAQARAELAQCVRVVRRSTNKLWTDTDLPRHA
jgi:hypothetical protein